MTTSRMQRCKHCNDVYVYHPSTYGFIPQYNDDKYCPDCLKIIIKSLSKRKHKFEKRWILTDDYTKEEIVNTQNKRCKDNPLAMLRIMAGLYKGNVTGVQALSQPVGLAYALKMVYNDNNFEDQNKNDIVENIKEENTEYEIKSEDIKKSIDKSEVKEERKEIKGIEIKKNSNIQNSICEEMKDPISGEMIYYYVTWWDDDLNSTEIKKEVWWDIENNCISKDQKKY